jgi:hypothetical protein
MAFVVADRVKDTTTTTGTGTITVSGTAPTGYQAFATAMSTNDSFYYCISDTTNGAWEVGFGTLASGTTITRDLVVASSNSNALVSFAAGTQVVFLDFPAAQYQNRGQDYATSIKYQNFLSIY